MKIPPSRRVHLLLNEEDEEPYHLSPPIRCYLEHSQVIVIQYPNEVRMHGESHSKLEEGLETVK